MENPLGKAYRNLPAIAREAAASYRDAAPFSHIVFRDFFDPQYLDQVLAEFPDLEKQNSIHYADSLQRKRAGKGEAFFGPVTQEMMRFLNAEPFLRFLQVLTGIKETLVGDPYFLGGGQHEIKTGGLLKIHADFNKHELFGLDRRVNVLVYLNKDWSPSFGGDFELWDRDMERCVKKVPPIFNTVAIFSTTDFSYHGHPDPLACPPDRSRKSLALYYYSDGRPQDEIVDGQEVHSTLFRARRTHVEDSRALRQSERERTTIGFKDFLPPVVGKLWRKYRQ